LAHSERGRGRALAALDRIELPATSRVNLIPAACHPDLIEIQPKAMQHLRRAMSDSDFGVREAAARALEKLPAQVRAAFDEGSSSPAGTTDKNATEPPAPIDWYRELLRAGATRALLGNLHQVGFPSYNFSTAQSHAATFECVTLRAASDVLVYNALKSAESLKLCFQQAGQAPDSYYLVTVAFAIAELKVEVERRAERAKRTFNTNGLPKMSCPACGDADAWREEPYSAIGQDGRTARVQVILCSSCGRFKVREVPPDPRPHLLLARQRKKGQFRVKLGVRPLGLDGEFLKPGTGRPQVYSATLRATRNFEEEVERCRPVRRLIHALGSDWDWELGLEACLELLDKLEAMPDVQIAWPAGEPLRLRRGDSPLLSVSARRDSQDWFELVGDLQVNETLALDLQQLLKQWERSPSRFVQLTDGQFLALTASLRDQIEQLSRLTTIRSGRVLTHKAAAAAWDIPGDSQWNEWRHQLLTADPGDEPVPSILRAELRPYQEDGFRWLARLSQLAIGGCLADDMGLGKTLQALALLALRGGKGPALVIAPASVVSVWQEQARLFVPELRCHSLPGASRMEFVAGLQPWDVLVASYGTLGDEIVSRHWATVILDEAQLIKNADTQRAQLAFRLQGDFRLALTGTPIENHLGELWSLFNFLNPGLLGSYRQFLLALAGPAESGVDESRTRLRLLLSPLILRRTKDAVLKELPPRTDLTIHVELSSEERALYEAIRREAVEDLRLQPHNPMHVLAHLTRLRKACCHPSFINPKLALQGAKLQALLDLLLDLRNGGHRCLVFSQFVTMLALVRGELDKAGISYEYLDGSLSAKERQATVAAFQNGSAPVFLISLKAGGTGLTLTAADYVVHVDPWWNPAVEDQASDRAHRLGQTRPVTVYRLITVGTVEQKIAQMHGCKRDLAESLLQDAGPGPKLAMDDWLELLETTCREV